MKDKFYSQLTWSEIEHGEGEEFNIELRKSALTLLKKGTFTVADFSEQCERIQEHFNRLDSNDIGLTPYLNQALTFMLAELPKINNRKAVIDSLSNALKDMAEMQSIDDNFDNDYMSVLASDLMTDLMGDNIETGNTSLMGFIEGLNSMFNQVLIMTETEEDIFDKIDKEAEKARELVEHYKRELAQDIAEKYNTSYKDVLSSMD